MKTFTDTQMTKPASDAANEIDALEAEIAALKSEREVIEGFLQRIGRTYRLRKPLFPRGASIELITDHEPYCEHIEVGFDEHGNVVRIEGWGE